MKNALLLIEDEALYHDYYKNVCAKFGLAFYGAKNGKEAIDFLDSKIKLTGNVPQSGMSGMETIEHEARGLGPAAPELCPEIKLIILDYEMPIMNGVKFLEERSYRPELLKIPVMMSSSYGEADPVFAEAKQNGWITRFIPKGCQVSELGVIFKDNNLL